MAYRDEIDHGRSDPRSGASRYSRGMQGATPDNRRGVLGGLAVAIGLVIVLFIVLSFVGGGDATGTAPAEGSMIAPAEAPEATAPAATPAE
ncbi:hypothetical protein FIU97_04700 [Roseivivax sp. THAF40]|uniref:hypothetical protein n=1 Tax=unclassified Roseivivax TaxID=2639302 RepID=UPI001268BDAA|nr:MULTISPECIES: hypothetical protein [unclassified Roseivivax]QFS82070.1 hypothetical protein FIV09_04440 [Roseivivax sp. THAF197b]QFT45870.1 hypothetical protein FIU97_04700 [Roseivivax sp. THAF40]